MFQKYNIMDILIETGRNNLRMKSQRTEINTEAQIISINDLVDISVMWFLTYNLFVYLRGTKAMMILKGISYFITLRILAASFDLRTVASTIDFLIQGGTVVLIVIFQPEIRRLLEECGRKVYIKQRTINYNEKMITALDGAIQYLAERKIGALITIQRRVGLDEFIATGVILDAEISEQLLTNIFTPNAPLHDGAVIIRNGKIVAGSAYLPSSDNMQIPKRFGTRHRAAIGVSEVSDALTVVVSEETGEVSITANGIFHNNVIQEEYLKILKKELTQSESEKV